jgi:methylated-DNA-[protein]-cysteine S-methyltransferase
MPHIKTPFGVMSFVTSQRGLVRIDLKGRGKPDSELAGNLDRKVAACLSDYFSGRAMSFSLPLDLGRVTQFQRSVMLACVRIPFGEIMTYAELAAKAGKPHAARAVGTIMAKNRIPIVIPCHRVVGSDWKLHGYAGGLEMKRKLLELEGFRIEGKGASAKVVKKAAAVKGKQ